MAPHHRAGFPLVHLHVMDAPGGLPEIRWTISSRGGRGHDRPGRPDRPGTADRPGVLASLGESGPTTMASAVERATIASTMGSGFAFVRWSLLHQPEDVRKGCSASPRPGGARDDRLVEPRADATWRDDRRLRSAEAPDDLRRDPRGCRPLGPATAGRIRPPVSRRPSHYGEPGALASTSTMFRGRHLQSWRSAIVARHLDSSVLIATRSFPGGKHVRRALVIVRRDERGRRPGETVNANRSGPTNRLGFQMSGVMPRGAIRDNAASATHRPRHSTDGPPQASGKTR